MTLTLPAVNGRVLSLCFYQVVEKLLTCSSQQFLLGGHLCVLVSTSPHLWVLTRSLLYVEIACYFMFTWISPKGSTSFTHSKDIKMSIS